jgi:hypothetical protein
VRRGCARVDGSNFVQVPAARRQRDASRQHAAIVVPVRGKRGKGSGSFPIRFAFPASSPCRISPTRFIAPS